MSDAPAMEQFTTDQLDEFRHTYIRDDWTGTAGLSRFNQANKKKFFEDDDLLLMEDRIRSDQLEELDEVWLDRKDERINQGDDDDDAEVEALATQTEARFRLLRARCLEIMMADPAFQASLVVGQTNLAPALFERWKDLIEEDRAWARSRSGEYGMIGVERR